MVYSILGNQLCVDLYSNNLCLNQHPDTPTVILDPKVNVPDTVNPASGASVPVNSQLRRPSDISPPFETNNGEAIYKTAMSFYIEVPRKAFYEKVAKDYLSSNPVEHWHIHADAVILDLLWNSILFPRWINPVILFKRSYEGIRWMVSFTCRPGCQAGFYLSAGTRTTMRKRGTCFSISCSNLASASTNQVWSLCISR